ncbi:hypothetical protein C8F01DRAFT_1237960 [Mycena amicta]|nr:hypothetical protein C8F01DRAFT_1238984 [Mycena amicta]KAJ7050092.1 hypothetical protein C8F01DRAFT_1237960 [Mycena amicta]
MITNSSAPETRRRCIRRYCAAERPRIKVVRRYGGSGANLDNDTLTPDSNGHSVTSTKPPKQLNDSGTGAASFRSANPDLSPDEILWIVNSVGVACAASRQFSTSWSAIGDDEMKQKMPAFSTGCLLQAVEPPLKSQCSRFRFGYFLWYTNADSWMIKSALSSLARWDELRGRWRLDACYISVRAEATAFLVASTIYQRAVNTSQVDSEVISSVEPLGSLLALRDGEQCKRVASDREGEYSVNFEGQPVLHPSAVDQCGTSDPIQPQSVARDASEGSFPAWLQSTSRSEDSDSEWRVKLGPNRLQWVLPLSSHDGRPVTERRGEVSCPSFGIQRLTVCLYFGNRDGGED